MTRRKKEEEILQDSIIELAKAARVYPLPHSRLQALDLWIPRPGAGPPKNRTADLHRVQVKIWDALMLSEEQTGVGQRFDYGASSARYFILFRPKDWADGTVEAILKTGAKRKEAEAMTDQPKK